MKKLEGILWCIVLFAAILKILRLPLSSFLLIIALTVLAMVYLVRAVMGGVKDEQHDRSATLETAVFLVMSVGCLGVMFKVQFWPMAAFFLMTSVPALIFLLLILLKQWNDHPDRSATLKPLLYRVAPMLVACVALYLISAERLMAFYYRDRPEIAPLMVRSLQTTDAAERERIFQQVDSINYARAFGEAPVDPASDTTAVPSAITRAADLHRELPFTGTAKEIHARNVLFLRDSSRWQFSDLSISDPQHLCTAKGRIPINYRAVTADSTETGTLDLTYTVKMQAADERLIIDFSDVRVDGLLAQNDSCWVKLPQGPYPDHPTARYARLRKEMIWNTMNQRVKDHLGMPFYLHALEHQVTLPR